MYKKKICRSIDAVQSIQLFIQEEYYNQSFSFFLGFNRQELSPADLSPVPLALICSSACRIM